jgi:hypothetical protein
VELYLHSPICLHCVVFKAAATQSATLGSLRTLRMLCSLHRVATQKAMFCTKVLSLDRDVGRKCAVGEQ